MPEVCEVALLCEYLVAKLKGRKISKFEILSGKYTNIKLENSELLNNAVIENIESKGKFMWFTLKNQNHNIYFMNWFGLSGYWSFKKSTSDRISMTIVTNNEDYKLYFSDQRNFGIMQITEDITILNKKLQDLAVDILKSGISTTDFINLFNEYLIKFPKRKKITIVDLLLRQDVNDGIVSGIGNYLSAEILYRAKISPFRKLETLTKSEIENLAIAARTTVKLCYFYNKTPYINKINIKPDKFIDYHKDINIKNKDFNFSVYRTKKDPLGNPVEHNVIAKGRTTYWVPNIQL